MSRNISIKWTDPGNQGMRLRQNGQVPFLTFPILEELPWLIHGFSTRLGGVSSGPCATMNLDPAREQNRENVEENLRRMGGALGFTTEHLVRTFQSHTDHVAVVNRNDCNCAGNRRTDLRDTDGLITGDPYAVLMVFVADCVPVLLADPVNRVIAAVHSGWRGTEKKITATAVRKMQEEFHSDPKDILAGIGPSICRDCYEVGEDVAEAFRSACPKDQWDSILLPGRKEGKFQLDLWEANRIILEAAGILPEHIQTGGLCTCCNPELLFSHRASGGKRGTLAGFIGFRQDEKSTYSSYS